MPSSVYNHIYKSERLGNYIKEGNGYKLERHFIEDISTKLGAETVTVKVSNELRELVELFPAGAKRGFLEETIDCFEAGANRATVVMCWVFTIDHLFDYIYAHKKAEFDTVLPQIQTKGLKSNA